MTQSKVKQSSAGDFSRMVVRRRYLFLGVLGVVFALSLAAFIVSSKRYTATGTVQFQKTGSDASGLSDLISGSGGGGSDVLSANVDLQTQDRILQSATLALTVIQDLSMEDDAAFKPRLGIRQRLLLPFRKPRPEEPRSVLLADSVIRRQRVLATFESNLNIHIIAGTRLLQIEYTDNDPVLAAKVVNRLIVALNDYTFQAKFKASSQVTDWLEQQLGGLRQTTENLQQKLVAVQKTTGLFGIGGTDQQGRSSIYSPTLDRLQQSNAELAQVEANLILKGAIYQVVKTGDAELISQLSGATMGVGAGQGVQNTFTGLQALRSEETTLGTEIAKDASVFGPAYPRLIEERASLAHVQTSIATEIQRISGRARSDYEIAVRSEESARKIFEDDRSAAEKLNDRNIEYTLLKREADSSEMLYQDLLRRLKEAGIIESLHSSNITVVDPAHTPADPSKPNFRFFFAFGLFGGLIIASGITYLRETIANTILSNEDVEQAGIPIFGTVPLVGLKQSRVNGIAGEAIKRERLELIDAPRSAFAESIRHLRSSLLLSRSAAPPQIILVTSGSPKEGKSTISVELAISFAQMNRPTLLVEADMRRPVVRQRLALAGTRGLSNVLTDGSEQPEFHQLADVPFLTVLPAGPVPPFSAELLGSQQMKTLLAKFRSEFAFIIIDCPPLLAITDAVMFAASTDAIMLVARSEQTGRSQLANSRRILSPFVEGADKKIFGAVINALTLSTLKYYGYYGSSYDRYYTEKEHA